ncbi:MAG TPA: carboxypeptidase-like regulatory domain-containing protein, partial [Labilithrix sp.]
MRTTLRYVAVMASAAAIIFACGSSGDDSGFGNPTGDDAGGSSGGSTSGFVTQDSGGGSSSSSGCMPLTCADQKANCGKVSDGCGGLLDCSGGMPCPDGTTCGGDPSKPSQCGKPPCTGKTCLQLGVDCGGQNDGCGNLINCGTCESGTCGGGGPSKCGGSSSSSSSGDGGGCVPTKTTCGPGDCGPQSDGCGGIISCPTTCPMGQTCGGDPMKPGLCGAPPCTKATCGAKNCGFIADGCGGVVDCWPAGGGNVCAPGMTCGGAGTANVCGTPAGCTGLCLQQQTCPGGATTSIEGYVTSPNGVLPVPNAVVYVPNGTVTAFAPGVACETCATASGSPLVSTSTDANGHFLLPNMPVSTPGKVVNIPVVVQLGRWRKQLTVSTTACTNTFIPSVVPAAPTTMAIPGAAATARPATDNTTAALARTQTEGDIPFTAISTGQVDGLECVFRKMGVADAEFSDGDGKNGAGTVTNGRIRLYQDPGSGNSAGGARISGTSPQADRLYCPAGRTGADSCGTANGAGKPNEIDSYDAVIFGCTGDQDNKGAIGAASSPLDNVANYANKGGRVFATHYSYVWLYQTTRANAAWAATANAWAPNTQAWSSTAAPGSISAFVDTSFPKGALFDNWLKAPVAPTSASYPPPYPGVSALWQTGPDMIAITEARADIAPAGVCTGGTKHNGEACTNTAHCNRTGGTGGTCAFAPNSGIVAPAQRWLYTTAAGSTVFDTADDPAALDAPMHYTFNTPQPAPAAPATQCGRVLYSDFHVSIGNTFNKTFPNECDSNPLTSQEKVLAYMLFDLASCVSSSGLPMCMPKSCMDQSIGCGGAGDGCGNAIDCGTCPLGQTCGGGGIPSQCGAPACTPKTCSAGMCGKLGDGCGGTLDCGMCMTGTCGGAGPNMCGMAMCMPGSCPAPAMGSACGPVADGCGGVNNCPCPMGVPCVNGVCGTPPCTPRTCMQAGAN